MRQPAGPEEKRTRWRRNDRNADSLSGCPCFSGHTGGSSGYQVWPDRRPPSQSWNPGRDQLLADAALFEGVPLGPPRYRGESRDLVVRPKRHYLDQTPFHLWRSLSVDLE